LLQPCSQLYLALRQPSCSPSAAFPQLRYSLFETFVQKMTLQPFFAAWLHPCGGHAATFSQPCGGSLVAYLLQPGGTLAAELLHPCHGLGADLSQPCGSLPACRFVAALWPLCCSLAAALLHPLWQPGGSLAPAFVQRAVCWPVQIVHVVAEADFCFFMFFYVFLCFFWFSA
jgi:hypothetical protein